MVNSETLQNGLKKIAETFGTSFPIEFYKRSLSLEKLPQLTSQELERDICELFLECVCGKLIEVCGETGHSGTGGAKLMYHVEKQSDIVSGGFYIEKYYAKQAVEALRAIGIEVTYYELEIPHDQLNVGFSASFNLQ